MSDLRRIREVNWEEVEIVNMSLALTTAHLQAMFSHAQACLPNEACGLLAARDGRVLRVYPVANATPSPFAYTMAPVEQVRVMSEIEAQGWEIAGIFHSHPSGPPTPSAADVRQAYYPESAYLILAPDESGEWKARAFEIVDGAVREVALVIVDC